MSEVLELRRAARLWGIQTDFINAHKKPQASTPEALKALLTLLSGIPICNSEDLVKASDLAWSKKIAQGLEPVSVIDEGQQFYFTAYFKPQFNNLSIEEFKAEITSENGSVKHLVLREVQLLKNLEFKGQFVSRVRLHFDSKLKMGYHHLKLSFQGNKFESFVIVTPKPEVLAEPKSWGVFSPIYAIRTEARKNMGDFSDLAELQKFIFEQGGQFVGTLPFLANDYSHLDSDPSPYSPLTRLFWNEIYLPTQASKNKGKMDASSPSRWVDYFKVYQQKKEQLKAEALEFFKNKEDQSSAYKEFISDSPYLEEYVAFRSQDQSRDEKQLHLYAQYRIHQILVKQKNASLENQTAGLYLDFPVGVRPGGFDSLKFSSSFLKQAIAGAPPDLVFSGGQSWGFAPLCPEAIRATKYEYLIAVLRQHMRYARILRVDHVMGFHRMYAIPHGLDPQHGAYIRYRRKELFAILRIESTRAKVTVVGEDLGTVPAAVREALNENNFLRMWVLPFEIEKSLREAFTKIPEQALACLNTHDMIPFEGHTQGLDLELYQDLKLMEPNQAQTEKGLRAQAVSSWLKELKVQDSSQLFDTLILKLAESRAQLLLLNIEDLWRETESQNVPGTWKENPNWRRKWRIEYETWREQSGILSLLHKISRARSRGNVKESSRQWNQKNFS